MKILTKSLSLILASFSSLTAGWHGPIDLFNTAYTMDLDVDIDASGNGVVMAIVTDDQESYYAKSAQLVNGAVQNIHNFPQEANASGTGAVSVNASGNATVVWVELDESLNGNVRAANLFNNIWSAPVTISNPDFLAQTDHAPGLHISDSNQIISGWTGQNTLNSNYLVQVNRFNFTRWGNVDTLQDSSDFIPLFKLAGSPSGHAIAAWNDGSSNLSVGYFDGKVWSINPVKQAFLEADSPILAADMNLLNTGAIMWNDRSSHSLTASFFSNGSFTQPTKIYTLSEQELVIAANIAMDPRGNAIAIWIAENYDTNVSKVLAASYTKGTWGTPESLATTDVTNNSFNYPNISFDGAGNGYAVWQIDTSNNSGAIYFNQFKASISSWSSESQLLSTPGIYATLPKLAVNAIGAATVAWIAEVEGNQTVQAICKDVLKPAAPTPPQQLIGQQVRNKFLDHTDIINILSWKPSLDRDVKKYNLYRNDRLIAVIKSTDPLIFEDHNRKAKRKYVYKLTAVNSDGIESSPAAFTF